ncbi:hypothetical protein HDZ31DRAFT_29432 [Schizophyllum fasciatum]
MGSYFYGQPAVSAHFPYVAQRGPGQIGKHPRPPGFVNGPVRKQQKHQKQQQKHSKAKHGGRATGLNAWTVLNEIEHAIHQKQIHAQYNPFDIKAQSDYHVLCQLRTVVQAGVSLADLQAIHNQLRTLLNPPAPTPSTWLPQPTVPAIATAQYPPLVNPSVPGPQSLNLENALLDLVRSGVIGTSSQQGTSSSVKPESTHMEVDDGPELSETGKYRRKVMRQKISLRDVGRTSLPTKDVLGQLLFENLPVLCRQCAQRFCNSSEGREAHQQHLDMHFRQNRHLQSHEGRGFSRSSYVDREDWVTSVDPKGKQRAFEQERESKVEAARRMEELQSRHFLEDDEEWVWTNAVKDGDTLYHATCQAELHMKRRNTLGARSRSRTPDVPSLERKAEDVHQDVARPSKRVSL